MKKFSVGDKVKWSTPVDRGAVTKFGTIAEVVPARKYPKNRGAGSGMAARDHESYVVAVERTERTGPEAKTRVHRTPLHYYPKVDQIELQGREPLRLVPLFLTPEGAESLGLRHDSLERCPMPHREDFRPFFGAQGMPMALVVVIDSAGYIVRDGAKVPMPTSLFGRHVLEVLREFNNPVLEGHADVPAPQPVPWR